MTTEESKFWGVHCNKLTSGNGQCAT